VQAVLGLNNLVQVFNYLEGDTISVFAGAGNDHVTVDASVTTWRAELFGEASNDRLYGGPMNDLLDGGPGNDYLDGGGGDNVLIGGGGHDVLKNGHAPLTLRAAVGASSKALSAIGTSTSSISAQLVQVPVQLDSRSRQPDLSRIDLSRAALGKSSQQLADKNSSRSRAILLEANKLTNGLDEELLGALVSGFLSKEHGSITGTMDVAFATYFNVT
jgi:Ca2+-binding RTX toxin-like protein